MNKKLFLLAFLATGAMVQGAALPEEGEPKASFFLPDNKAGMYPLKKTLGATLEHIAEEADLGDPGRLVMVVGARLITPQNFPEMRGVLSNETCVRIVKVGDNK